MLPILFAPVDRDPHPFPDPATDSGSDALFAVAAVAERYAVQVAGSLVAAGVTTFELSNELDNRCIQLDAKGNAPNGNLPTMFNDTKFTYYAAILRGLNAGVKRASPAAKTIVNSAGWLHYGFFTRLVTELGLPFDIIGCHPGSHSYQDYHMGILIESRQALISYQDHHVVSEFGACRIVFHPRKKRMRSCFRLKWGVQIPCTFSTRTKHPVLTRPISYL